MQVSLIQRLFPLLLTVSFFGCGSAESPEVPVQEEELFTVLTDDFETSALGTSDEPDSEPEISTSMTGNSSAEKPSEYEELLMAQDAEWTARCDCTFEEQGFDTSETCFAAMRRPDFDRSCSLAAFDADRASLALVNSCFAEARQLSADCLVNSGCAAEAECDAERDVLRRRCQFFRESATRYLESNQACQRNNRLGQTDPVAGASSCPQVVGASTLGQRVFVGSTTGQGDRVALSCQFGEVESADVSHQWTAPFAGRYLFSTLGTRFIPALAVFDDCDGAELACSANTEPRVSVNLEAGQTVIVTIEGTDILQSGYYALNIQRLN